MTDYSKEEQHIKEYEEFVFGGLKCDCDPEKDLLECPPCLRKRKEAALKVANRDYVATVTRQTEIFKLLWANNIVFLGAFGYLFINQNDISLVLAFFVAFGAFVHTAIIEGVYQSALDLSKFWMSHMYHLENAIWGRLNKTETFTNYNPKKVSILDHRTRTSSVFTVEKGFLIVYAVAMGLVIILYCSSRELFNLTITPSWASATMASLMGFFAVVTVLLYLCPKIKRYFLPREQVKEVHYGYVTSNWYDKKELR